MRDDFGPVRNICVVNEGGHQAEIDRIVIGSDEEAVREMID